MEDTTIEKLDEAFEKEYQTKSLEPKFGIGDSLVYTYQNYSVIFTVKKIEITMYGITYNEKDAAYCRKIKYEVVEE